MNVFLKAAAALLASGATTSGAEAAVVFDVVETGADITIKASGAFDRSLSVTSGTTTNTGGTGVIRGTLARLNFNAGKGNTYTFNSSLVLGPGKNQNIIRPISGILIGFIPDTFFIDQNYVSNSAIAAEGIVVGKTLEEAGLTAGNYNYMIGGNAMTINISRFVAPPPPVITPPVVFPPSGPDSGGPTPAPVAAAVPEPATWAMMILGFGVVGGAMRRRPKVAVRFA